MRLTGRIFPLRVPSRDGRIITDVRIGLDGIPLYLEGERAVGHLHEIIIDHTSIFGVFALVDQDVINTWQPGRLHFQAEVDQVEGAEREVGCTMVRLGGRLRRVVLGANPAFEGTEAYLET